MNWGRAKTILIVIFLCADIFLALNIFSSDLRASSVPADAVTNTADVLSKNGIKVDPSVIPVKIPSCGTPEAVNAISTYEDFASSLLGENAADSGENLWQSDKGKLTFSGDSFHASLRYPIDLSDEKTLRSQLGSFNLSKAKITLEQNSAKIQGFYEKNPVFNSEITITSTKDATDISGCWFIPSEVSGKIELKSAAAALIDFIPSAKAPCEISDIAFGYTVFDGEIYHKSAYLVPVWRITLTSGEEFFADARTD